MGQIQYPGIGIIDFNDKYSFKDFTGKTLVDATDLEGITIYGSCFSHETPDTRVFPNSLKKITLVNCNLDNVFLVKPGWEVIGGSQRRFKVQNDKNDWLIDDANNPTLPIDHKIFTKLGLAMPSPIDIPSKMIEGEAINLIKAAEKIEVII